MNNAPDTADRFGILMETNPLPTYIFEVATLHFLMVNTAALHLYGYTREEFLSLTLADIRPPEEVQRLIESIHTAPADIYIADGWKHKKKNGEILDVEISSHTLALNGKNARLVVVRDMTEERKAKRMLKESEERYRRFFEEDLSGDFISTVEGKLLECNPAFARIFGFATIAQALDTPAHNFYANPEERKEFLRVLQEHQHIENHEIEMVRLDGTHITIIENVNGIFNERNELISLRGYVFDITERKRLETQLLQAQKMQGIGVLAGGIAHHFNNILGIILAQASVLKRAANDAQRINEIATTIADTVHRGAELTQQLLAFAQERDTEIAPLAVNDVLRDVMRLLHNTLPKDIQLHTTFADGLPPIFINRMQLHQTVLRMCMNAREAMAKGGALTITTALAEGTAVRALLPKETARQYIAIAVTDTGIGMTAAVKDRIYEPFFTTKGMANVKGLGLSLVHGIVTRNHGAIDVQSEAGKGTTFVLYFPAIEEADEDEFLHPAKKESAAQSTILFIEDEEMLGVVAKSTLEDAGYIVLWAKDGEQAVALYKEHHKEIALVITDMGLPKLGGWEVFEQLRALNPKVQVVIASGFIADNLKRQMLEHGAMDIINKPYRLEDLLARVKKILM